MAANEQQWKGSDDSQEPAHHARRPMNAFLIFCKKHRSSVRKSFPNLENRAVTRVLGEWWAALGPDQKCDYVNLAHNYKDAFLNANPNFKWYKLPAPPLRTLTTRPRNKKLDVERNEGNTGAEERNFGKEGLSIKSEPEENDGSIHPGKLADESQIGGLSSLFTPQKKAKTLLEPTTQEAKSNSEGEPPTSPKKKYTEIRVDDTQRRKCKIDLFCEEKIINESNNNEHHHHHHHHHLHHRHHHLNEKEEEEEEEEEEDDEDEGEEKNKRKIYTEGIETPEVNNARTERSCKGLRYQQLMAEQQRLVSAPGHQVKRRRLAPLNTHEERSNERRNSISSNVSEKTDSLSSEGGNSSRSDLEHLVESAEGKLEASKPEDTETEGAESRHDYCKWPPYKRFKAEDFNLEKKIEALPELSLEEFLSKKKQQRTKKKKTSDKTTCARSGGRRMASSSTSETASAGNNGDSSHEFSSSHEDPEKLLLVGSQKRKARKRSIMRNTGATSGEGSVVSRPDQQHHENKGWCASPDLDALACLAEIAANRTKLTK